MKLFIIILISIFIPAIAKAQYLSQPLHKFQVDNIRGCAPLTVQLTNLIPNACTNSNICIMVYDGCPAGCQNVFTMQFNNPGTYPIVVNYPGQGSTAETITITVDPDSKPGFDIYSCLNSKVEINITDKTYDSYTVDFNNDGIIDNTISSGPNQTISHDYGAGVIPTNYRIKVRGKKSNAANNCSINSKVYTTISSLPPPIFNTLDAITSDTLQLGFTPITNIQYQIEFATNSATNFQVYKNVYGIKKFSVPNLKVDNNFYCFRLSSHDPCANANVSSIPVCSQIFDLSASSSVNQLSWQTAGNISTFAIKRDGINLVSPPLAGSTRTYPDRNINCKITYKYRLIGTYSNGAVSTSLQKPLTAIVTNTPLAIDNISSLNNDNQAQLTWIQSPLYTTSQYVILRNASGGSYSTYGGSTTTDFTDNKFDLNAAICYEINYVDDCDNPSSPGAPVCPIVLKGTLDDKNEVTLNWSDYYGWNQGVKNYAIQKFNADGTLIKTFFPITGTTLLDNGIDPNNQLVYYKVIAFANELGITQSESNKVRIEKQVNLYFPTAFNPESKHAENNTFTVKGHFIASLQLMVFDRWGTLVFSSNQNEAWDGKKDGVQMPTGTYVWTAQGADIAGKSFKEAGTVLLIRHKN